VARPRKNLTVHLEGFAELEAEFKRLGDRAGGNLIKESAEAGAEVIRLEAERNAPTGPRGDAQSPASRKYGPLKPNIEKAVHRFQFGRSIIHVGPGSDHFWGKFLEKGTSRMPAKPYLRPAFDTQKEAALNAVRRVLMRLLDGI
jgi:HK97 gp10 family phage protein